MSTFELDDESELIAASIVFKAVVSAVLSLLEIDPLLTSESSCAKSLVSGEEELEVELVDDVELELLELESLNVSEKTDFNSEACAEVRLPEETRLEIKLSTLVFGSVSDEEDEELLRELSIESNALDSAD